MAGSAAREGGLYHPIVNLAALPILKAVLPLLIGCFLWALAAGAFVCVAPDTLLAVCCVLYPMWWKRFALEGLVGSLAGAALLYELAARDEEAIERFLTHFPGTSPAYVKRVREAVRSGSALSLAKGSLLGFPLRVLALEAGASGQSLPKLLLVTAPFLLARFALVCGLSAWLLPGIRLPKVPLLVALAGLLVTAAYLALLEWRNPRGGEPAEPPVEGQPAEAAPESSESPEAPVPSEPSKPSEPAERL